MTTHSSILAWRIPQTKEPGRLHSMGSERLTLSLSHFPPILFLIYLNKQASTRSPNPASVFRYIFLRSVCFPGLPWWLSSKESTCNAGEAGGVGLILGRKDPLEEGMATHSSILAWRTPQGRKESDMTEVTSHASIFLDYLICLAGLLYHQIIFHENIHEHVYICF